MSAPTLMIQGTASGVGKSILTAAFCRIFARQGMRVLPFKAQNMSNNAAVTAEGGEIGRAQALQARAAGVTPHVLMNPVLLKPMADQRSDVVLLGRSRPDLRELPWHERKTVLWSQVADSLDTLRSSADLVVIEGAGSPAETNLRASDIVNMAVAHHAVATVLLVADIDRGGAFAALYGTWALLEPNDRARIRGFILNRFRGDAGLLAPAPDDLERATGIPTLGVVPFVRHDLPDEDAFGMRSRNGGAIRVAAVRFPHIANFDDLDPIAREPASSVHWTQDAGAIHNAHAIVLPGTRNSVADLQWLWESGLAAVIRARAAAGIPVVGLCGGYQMLGTTIRDPNQIEGGGSCAGLGLLDGETELMAVKHTRAVTALATRLPFLSDQPMRLSGYEIHHGETTTDRHTCMTVEDKPIGSCKDNVWGAYLHGIFDNDAFRAAWLGSLGGAASALRWTEHIDRELDRLADAVCGSVDLHRICSLIWPAR
ncbi:MAG: cobyric acid synthase [Gemmatimonadota bacterium]